MSWIASINGLLASHENAALCLSFSKCPFQCSFQQLILFCITFIALGLAEIRFCLRNGSLILKITPAMISPLSNTEILIIRNMSSFVECFTLKFHHVTLKFFSLRSLPPCPEEIALQGESCRGSLPKRQIFFN